MDNIKKFDAMLGMVDRIRSNVHLIFDVFSHYNDNRSELKSKIEKYSTDAKTNLQDLKLQTEQMKALLVERSDHSYPDKSELKGKIDSLKIHAEKRSYATASLNAELEQCGFHHMRTKRQKLVHPAEEGKGSSTTGVTIKKPRRNA